MPTPVSTPLDGLFLSEDSTPPDALSKTATDEIKAYAEYLDQTIPPKREVSSNLLIATWNIAHFRSLTRRWQVPKKSKLSPKRDYRDLWAITETLSRFDVIAVQEIGGDLRALRYAMKVLGPNWGFLMSDVSAGERNNYERMAFIFDKRRVTPSGLAGELVVPDDAEKFGFKKDAFKKQFARSPYTVSFQAKNVTFILVTAHIDFGDEDEERIPEIKAISQWMAKWADNSKRWHHNLLVLGDFNLDRAGNKMYEAFTQTGLEVPFVLHSFPRTIYGRTDNPQAKSYHDQIAWFSKGKRALIDITLSTGGTVMIYDHLLKDLKLSRKSFASRISDHYPLWVEFNTVDI